MANRRMFSLRVINSARFLKMPISSQALYFHLGLNADDDGVVEAYNVIKTCGCTEDDLRVLVSKGFVQVLNEDLVSYITDWNENNKIRADRKIDSIYKDLLISINPDVVLIEKKQRADVKRTTNGQPMDNQWTTNGRHRIGKDRIGKDRIGKDKEKEALAPYFEDAELNEVFKDFIEMRKKIRKPMTDKAITLAITKLNKLSENDKDKAIAILNQSIESSWTGLYPLHEDKKIAPSKTNQTAQELDDFYKMVADWADGGDST